MKKIIISFSIFLCISGCWNYKELNDYSIVTGIAIDKKKDDYEVSVLISNSPKSNGENDSTQSQIVVYSGTGDTIYRAFKDIGLISPKELYLGHFSVLVLSEDIAKDGINKVIDLFLRESSVKKNFYVTISKDCKAKDTLKIITPLTDFPSQNISDNLNSTTQLQGLVSNINFNELVSKLIKKGINPTINSIIIKGDVKDGATKKNAENSEPNSYIKLDVLGIFKNDKLINWANYNESVGINIINNKITEMYLKVNHEDGYVVFNTTYFKTVVNVNLNNNNPIVNISSNGEAKIIEVNGNIDLNDDNVILELQKKANKNIKKYISDAINVSKKYKTDIFGFGLKFYQKYPKYFNKVKKNWNDNLNELEFNIKSDVTLKTKGSSQNSLEAMNHER